MGELSSGHSIHRLLDVVRGCMVTVVNPIIEYLLFRRVGRPSEFKSQSWNPLANKTSLIAANEPVLRWLLVELHLDIVQLRHCADVVAQGRLSQTLHLEIAQRKQR